MRNYIPKILKFFLYILPLMEIAGFIIVGKWIGVLPTILLVVFSTFLGLSVLRIQGFVSLIGMQRRINAGEYPAINVLDSSLMMFGGLLLIVPGFITDIVGLFLLIPQVRSLILRWLISVGILVPGPIEVSTTSFSHSYTIEGEFKKEDQGK